ncbi:MAG: response regulator [Desulfuromonadaceae bacterium]|nr:response regulator [Desulfuromonadaceae bacterium]
MSRKLLLADDSVTIQKVIEITFANQNFDLTMVGNGDDALEKARNDPPDIILADIIMPGKNGYELCRAVKQTPDLAHIPILLLVGSFEPFDEEKARAIGADGWIAKPFETQALIGKVQDLLEKASPPRAAAEPDANLAAEEDARPDLLFEEEEGLSFSVDLEEIAAPAAAAAPNIFADVEESGPSATLSDIRLPETQEKDSREELPEDFLTQDEPGSELPEPVEEAIERVPDFSFNADEGQPLSDGMVTVPESEFPFEFYSGPEKEEGAISTPAMKEETFSSIGEGSEFSPPSRQEEETLATEEVRFLSQPFSPGEEEEVLFLSEDDILVEEEDLSIPEETSYPDVKKVEEEQVPGNLALACQGLSEEEPSLAGEEATAEVEPMLIEEPLAEPESMFIEEPLPEPESIATEGPPAVSQLLFELEEPPEREDSDKEEVEFSVDTFAGEDLVEEETEPVAAEPVADLLKFDLSNEGGEDLQPETTLAVETAAEEDAAAPETVPAVAANAVEQKIASLGDEELYAIVERVAKDRLDKMALEILERIAWEVVPNMSESLIREEIRKIRELQR